MTKYVSLVNIRLGCFIAWRLEHVPRDLNEKADALVAVAASLPIKEIMLLPVYYQPELSITTNRVNEIDEACPFWMTLIVCYLSSGELMDNRVEAHKIQVTTISAISILKVLKHNIFPLLKGHNLPVEKIRGHYEYRGL